MILLTSLKSPILTWQVVSGIFHRISEFNSPRSATELPLTEADDVVSGVVPIIKEFLNELPSWKHQKRPVVNGELATAVCAELVEKNPGTCPPTLQLTVAMTAHLIQVSYSGPISLISC